MADSRVRRSPHEGRGWSDTTTSLHEQRLDAVVEHVMAGGTRTVLDLGCGAGALLERLAREPRLKRIVGVDRSAMALAQARSRLSGATTVMDARVTLVLGSITGDAIELRTPDAAALVEVLEHVDPGELSAVERTLFRRLRPGRVIITTPNREYNAVYGLEPGERRHPDHAFEWDRGSFRRWSSGVAARNGYDLAMEGVGSVHAWFGTPTQLAVFSRAGP